MRTVSFGLGGKLIRTVSFFGFTLEASPWGGWFSSDISGINEAIFSQWGVKCLVSKQKQLSALLPPSNPSFAFQVSASNA